MADQAHRLALLGLNDEEIAHAFGISHDTFYKWFKKHDAFAEAILAGKERADADVAFSLYQRAKGVTVISEKAFKGAKGDVVVAETRTQLPGDVRAAEIWLRNRQRKRWAKPEDMPADPEGEKALADMSDEDLERRRAEIEATSNHRTPCFIASKVAIQANDKAEERTKIPAKAKKYGTRCSDHWLFRRIRSARANPRRDRPMPQAMRVASL